MTEQADLARSTGRALPGQGRRRVVGKGQLAVSAIGMLIALGALCQGRVLQAGIIVLLTVGILEVMFQRALMLFQTGSAARAAQLPPMTRESPRPAAAGE